MSSYLMLRPASIVLEITPREVSEITKFLGESDHGDVIWDRDGEKRIVPVAVIGNAFDTYQYNLMLKRHRKLVDMPPVLIQLGQTILIQAIGPVSLERVTQGSTYKGPPPFTGRRS